jgi:hypothetical protein
MGGNTILISQGPPNLLRLFKTLEEQTFSLSLQDIEVVVYPLIPCKNNKDSNMYIIYVRVHYI